MVTSQKDNTSMRRSGNGRFQRGMLLFEYANFRVRQFGCVGLIQVFRTPGLCEKVQET